MKVLVACEFSGIVRDAFRDRGHYAMSVDLLPSERPGPHVQGDIREFFAAADQWDLMLAFPPCTYLCRSGARWHQGSERQLQALELVRWLLDRPVPRICLENPRGVISTAIRRPDVVIQPWEYGHPETKATCLWLKGLPPLMAEALVAGRYPRVHRASPGPERWKERSRTLPGIADAMARQWG